MCAALFLTEQERETSATAVDLEDCDDEPFFDASADEVVEKTEEPMDEDPAAWMMDEELGCRAPEVEVTEEEEYDAYNLDEDSQRSMHEIDSKKDEARKVNLLLSAANRQGRKDMRTEIAEEWNKMAVFIAWSACKSLNVYDTLRKMIMYEARKPFVYPHPMTGEAVEVEPILCSRLMSASHANASQLFKWNQSFLNDVRNAREVET